MHGFTPVSLKAQRGVSLSGLIIVLGMILALVMLGLKIVPKVLEYHAAKSAIASAKATNGTPAEIRAAFVNNAELNDVDSIDAKDLIITQVNGNTEVAFDYETRIPLFTNVQLLVRFAATTDSTGVIPEKPEKSTR